jgi:GNAT superfamily N-acetyltransferase
MPVRKLLPTELAWANQRYAEIDFVPSRESDLIAVAEHDGIKAGLGRITQVQERVGELGGMIVLPAYRGQSIASHIFIKALGLNQ